MIDNKRIDREKADNRRRRRTSVIIKAVILHVIFAAAVYALLIVYPAWDSGQDNIFLLPFLRDRLVTPSAEQIPEPAPLPAPSPTATPEPTEEPTPTPTPEPTLAPEITAIDLPGYSGHSLDEWNLILVNKDHLIPEDYSFNRVYLESGGGHSVDARCADDLLQMIADCRAAGNTPIICSAYRDPATQQTLYSAHDDDRAARDAIIEEARKNHTDPGITASDSVAVPGASEHEIGIAVDIYSDENLTLDESQEKTKTQQWLMEHCWDYGFILRYPKDKTEITGIVYEPWHYRYVGRDAALDMRDSGLCLEEYIENMTAVKEAEAELAKLLAQE